MHSDIHHLLHAYRATELRYEARKYAPAHPGLRHRVGWAMIELGLRLTQAGPAPTRAARAA
ncbi:hypothetical protein [Streptomyces sp. ALB3]|uniref:hypothetical protein n=1 Tax=Streptomyces sp. ALB3 TaxID=3374278 RepID=UPI0037949C40